MTCRRRRLIVPVVVLLLASWTAPRAATTWPGGLDEATIVTGLDMPTAFAHAADGRIFIAENDGRVRVIPVVWAGNSDKRARDSAGCRTPQEIAAIMSGDWSVDQSGTQEAAS